MTKYKAKFIALEGIDGTGKTTTAKKLEEHYESLGKKVFLYHEPYKFDSFDVKEIIKNFESEGKEVSDFAVLSLMIASREISIKNILIPELEKNDIVIADRYYYSTYTYQANIIYDYFEDYGSYIENNNYPSPDKVILFTIKDIDDYQNNESDKFEIQDISKFKAIQKSYIDLFKDMDLSGEIFFGEPFDSSVFHYIEVNQNVQPYFDFNQVLQAVEDL